MLKPYPQRVDATLKLMESFIDFTSDNSKKILALRDQAKKKQMTQEYFPIKWKLDPGSFKEITFKGYEAGKKPSEVSGLPRLYYDRNKPFEKRVPFYNIYRDTFSIKKPNAYIIPQGWWKVIERLQANKVRMRQFKTDTLIEVEAYRIINYQSIQRPYEGHHFNTVNGLTTSKRKIKFRKGDWYIPVDQEANRFLIETLEPQAEDSYFTWNFFDPILEQKEHFSSYVFEETATAFLKKNPDIRKKLDDKKAADPAFAANGKEQLNFVFENSPYYEPAHLEYPVYRLIN
jgi:hypothetical protein